MTRVMKRGGVTTITLNRPQQRNALNEDVIRRLADATAEAAAESAMASAKSEFDAALAAAVEATRAEAARAASSSSEEAVAAAVAQALASAEAEHAAALEAAKAAAAAAQTKLEKAVKKGKSIEADKTALATDFETAKSRIAELEAAGAGRSLTSQTAGSKAKMTSAPTDKPQTPSRPLNPVVLVAAAAGCTVVGALGYYLLFFGS